MAPREDRASVAARRTLRLLAAMGGEVRMGRRRAGWTQAHLGRLVGVSKSTVSRIEGGEYRPLTFKLAARMAAVLGAELGARFFPVGEPVRDVGHLALLEALRREVSPAFRWQTELPMRIAGDRRAVDAALIGEGLRIGVEAEMALEDLQALERELNLKLRDSGLDRMILVVNDTERNRRILAANRGTLRPSFPLSTAEVLAALRRGIDPGANGIVVLAAGRQRARVRAER
jgi:DNA-binding XRE family transcriptional regulator